MVYCKKFRGWLERSFSSLLQKPSKSNKSESKEAIREKQKDILMYKFGAKSKSRLETCHPDIQKICNELIKIMDVTVLEGVRTKEQQEEYVRTGKSKTMNSKHLEQGDGYSHAVDLAPFPIDWNYRERFVYMQGMIRGIALQLGIEVRSGIDWDSDGQVKDHTFFDGPHFELKK